MPILVHVLVIEAGIAARIGRRCRVLAVIVEGAPVLLDRVRGGRGHHEFGLLLISRRRVVDAAVRVLAEGQERGNPGLGQRR